MELPAPDPAALLTTWMEWEKGDALPGKVLADLKRAGMRELLDTLAGAAPRPGAVLQVEVPPEPATAAAASPGTTPPVRPAGEE